MVQITLYNECEYVNTDVIQKNEVSSPISIVIQVFHHIFDKYIYSNVRRN